MESIKISVTGNICNVTSKPSHITEGTVGLPVEFTFDSSWDGLCKTAVFMAGKMRMVVDSVNNVAIVPWEILRIPGFQLNVGVYGINVEGTTEISSTWVHAGAIQPAANGFNLYFLAYFLNKYHQK